MKPLNCYKRNDASVMFDDISKKSECQDGELCKNLKSMEYLSAIFGIKCPLELSKKTVVLCILYWLILISPIVFMAYKAVACLIGVDAAMDDSNTSLYIIMLLGFGIAPICVAFGTFYVPSRFKKFESTLDEMMLDKRFEQSFGDVRKKSKFILGLVLTIFVVLFFPAMSSGPPFTNNYLCFISPFNWTSPYTEIQHVVSSAAALFLFCKRLSIHGLMYIICYIIKKEFLKFDEEFSAMLGAEPSKKNIKYFQKRYFLICRHLEEADGVLCPFVTLLLFVLIPEFCLLMRTVIYGNLTMYDMAVYIGVMPVILIEICSILIQGSMLHNASKRCLEVVHDLDGNKMNVKSIALVTLFADNVRYSDYGLSFMKLFILNNSVIITVIGTIVSYTVVIMQLQF